MTNQDAQPTFPCDYCQTWKPLDKFRRTRIANDGTEKPNGRKCAVCEKAAADAKTLEWKRRHPEWHPKCPRRLEARHALTCTVIKNANLHGRES